MRERAQHSELKQRRENDALFLFFFFQAEDGIRDLTVTGVQTCALPISLACRARATTHPSPPLFPAPATTSAPRESTAGHARAIRDAPARPAASPSPPDGIRDRGAAAGAPPPPAVPALPRDGGPRPPPHRLPPPQ